MSTATFRGGAVYSGPDSTKYYALSGSEGAQQVDVLWKEKSYYYIHLSAAKYHGYVAESRISGSPSVSVFAPVLNDGTKRYVAASENAYLGPAAHYETTNAPKRAQMVDYLGKKDSGLAFIEYALQGYSRKFRAWFPASSLNYNKGSSLSPAQYLENITENVNPNENRFSNYYDSEGNRVTRCNHYAYYAMLECDAPLPLRADGTPAVCKDILSALSSGFEKWRVIDMDKAYEEAQARANHGYPTIALEEGHVAVVRPNDDGSIPSSKANVRISQAGAYIFDDGSLSQGWSVTGSAYNRIQFFSWYY